MRRHLLFPLIVFILIASLSFIPSRAGKGVMNTKITLKDISRHGLLLIGPTSPSFNENLFLALGARSAEIPDKAKLLSVFVKNSSQNAVVAYSLKWELVDANGKIITHERIYKEPTLLMENRTTQDQRSIDTGGDSIKPGASRFISLVPMLTDTRLGQGSIGGGFFGPMNADEIDSVRHAVQNRDTTVITNKLTEGMEGIIRVTVSIDGAFFEDGTFVGTDKSGFFSKTKAHLDARYDLYTDVLTMSRSKKSSSKILQHLTNFANVAGFNIKSDSPPSQFYDFYKMLYAREISRVWTVSGEQVALRYVESSLSKPWAFLRKLE